VSEQCLNSASNSASTVNPPFHVQKRLERKGARGKSQPHPFNQPPSAGAVRVDASSRGPSITSTASSSATPMVPIPISFTVAVSLPRLAGRLMRRRVSRPVTLAISITVSIMASVSMPLPIWRHPSPPSYVFIHFHLHR